MCGAYFRNGDVWQHVTTGEMIHLGHDCAEKYGLEADRAAWERWHKAEAEKRSIARIEQKRAAARDAYLAERPELAAALQVDHPILRDMAAKLHRYGSLSEKQIAFAVKLAGEAQTKKQAQAEERHVPAPQGRVTFRGRVVSIKTYESDWGPSTKLIVKMETADGCWLAMVSEPRDLYALRGDVVEMTATLKTGREAHFALGSRPTGAWVRERGAFRSAEAV